MTAYSTALFSTWIFVEPYGVLFDCGDGVTAALMQKSRKIKHVLFSHADRDHVTGLLQMNQLNARKELSFYYPEHCGTFPALQQFASKFDPHMSGTQWVPISSGAQFELKDDLSICALKNGHVEAEAHLTKSLSYLVKQSKKKLRSQFLGLPGQEIAKLKMERPENEMFDIQESVEFAYSGDTPVENDGRYFKSRVLVHEATFLQKQELDSGDTERHLHSTLDSVMEMVAESEIEHLVLNHFSSRYSDEQIDEAVERERKRCGVSIPIDVIYPGQVAKLQLS